MKRKEGREVDVERKRAKEEERREEKNCRDGREDGDR